MTRLELDISRAAVNMSMSRACYLRLHWLDLPGGSKDSVSTPRCGGTTGILVKQQAREGSARQVVNGGLKEKGVGV